MTAESPNEFPGPFSERERADAIALDAYHGRVRNFKTAKEFGWDVSAAEYFGKP